MTGQSVTSSKSEPITVMWNDSLQKISKNIDALQIIYILAYLNCNEFLEVFKHLIKDEKQQLEFIDLLREHSLISFDKGKDICKIDHSLQVEIRKQLVENGKEIEVLKSALLLLDSYDKYAYSEMETIDINHLKVNLESVFSYGSKYNSLIELFYKNVYMSSYHSTPIHFLAQSGNIDAITRIVEFLKTYRQKELLDVINAFNKNNETCLHFAVKFKFNVGVIKFLIENGANVNAVNHENKSILHYAVKLCTLEIVQLLIDSGANVKAEGISTLYCAATLYNLGIFKLLLENGANVNAVDDENKSILHYAAEIGYLEIVKSLIEHGANINAVDNQNTRVLHFAIKSKSDTITIHSKNMTIEYLIDHGATVHNSNHLYENLIMIALKRRNIDIVYCLIKKGSDMNIDDKFNTLLYMAAECDNVDIFNYILLIQEFDYNSCGRTSHFVTLFSRNLDNFYNIMLLNRNNYTMAQVRYNNLRYKTYKDVYISLLHVAIAFDNLAVVKLFIEKELKGGGERFNILEDITNATYNVSALHIAVLYKSLNVMRYFIELNDLCRVKFNEINEKINFSSLFQKEIYANRYKLLDDILKLSNVLDVKVLEPAPRKEDFDFYT